MVNQVYVELAEKNSARTSYRRQLPVGFRA